MSSAAGRRASLRSGGRNTAVSLSKAEQRSPSVGGSPRRGRGGRRGRQDKLQPKINDSLKATRRGGRRGTAKKGSTNKILKEEDEEEYVVEDVSSEDVDKEEEPMEINLGEAVEILTEGQRKPRVANVKESSGDNKLSKEDELQLLRDFDLNGTYGACRGISRSERYERAMKYDLQPPPVPVIADILQKHAQDFEYNTCIWDQNDLLRVNK